MAEQKQPLMYSDKDIELIKATFSENDVLLQAIRKLFFGVEISTSEKKMVKDTFSSDELVEVVRRKVYGLNNFDTPVGQLSDFWLGAESQVFGASPIAIEQTLKSKSQVLSMFEQAFKLLKDPSGEKVSIEVLPFEEDELGINIIARNLYMKAIETSLLTMKTIAGMKNETLEQTLGRLQQDSTK